MSITLFCFLVNKKQTTKKSGKHQTILWFVLGLADRDADYSGA